MGKADDTKRMIMKSAVAVFARKGYASATTREIADSAGVSEAALFKYYKSKKGLLHETVLDFITRMGIDQMFEGIDDIAKQSSKLSTEEFLQKLFSDRVSMIERNFQMFKILFIEIQYHEDVREIFMEKIMSKISYYAQLMSSLFEEREEIRKDLDYFTMIRSFIGVVFLTVMQKKLLPELDITKKDMETEIKNMVDLFMRGILKEDKE